jgi:hypothetical protein
MLQQANKPVMFAWARCHFNAINKNGLSILITTPITAFVCVWSDCNGYVFHFFFLPLGFGAGFAACMAQ